MNKPGTDSSDVAKTTTSSRNPRPLIVIVGLLLLLWIGDPMRLLVLPMSERVQTFTTIFLGIFIEAVPFLLAGSVLSGLIEVFVDKNTLMRLLPRRTVPATLTGALLGIAFPVCECGVVPVTRRLYQKGMPLSVGVAFLLAAPVVNPIVLLSTYTAFGFGPLLVARFLFSFVIAATVGLLFSLANPQEVLRQQDEWAHPLSENIGTQSTALSGSLINRLWSALAIGGDDFLDMARYLIVGSMLAAALQTLVPQATLLTLGSGTMVPVLVMMVLAYVLSICSTVDAFVALSFVNSFSIGSILAFLVFGPMVDIKSTIMFLGVFRRRAVLYLILIPALMALLMGVFINLNLRI